MHGERLVIDQDGYQLIQVNVVANQDEMNRFVRVYYLNCMFLVLMEYAVVYYCD
jgi:hypothetical protein